MALKNNFMFQYISCLRKCHPSWQFFCPPAGPVSPRLSLSTVGREWPDLKRREKHLALTSTPDPHFSDGQVCGSSLLLPSNVQPMKDHKTQRTEMEQSLSSEVSLSMCPTEASESWSTFFWAFVSWSLGLVSPFSLLCGFTTLNSVPSLKSLSEWGFF